MELNKKMVTAFIITTFTIAGTALASYTTTFSLKSSDGNSTTVVTTEKTSAVTASNPTVTVLASQPKSVEVITESPETILANTIFRILGLPVSVSEITSLKAYNMGYGEITLAYNLASASGNSVDKILDMRFNEKMGWGKIAKVLGVKMHGAVDQSVYILRESKLDSDADNLVISIGNIDTDQDDDNNRDEKHIHKDSSQDAHHNHQGEDKPNKNKGNSK